MLSAIMYLELEKFERKIELPSMSVLHNLKPASVYLQIRYLFEQCLVIGEHKSVQIEVPSHTFHSVIRKLLSSHSIHSRGALPVIRFVGGAMIDCVPIERSLQEASVHTDRNVFQEVSCGCFVDSVELRSNLDGERILCP